MYYASIKTDIFGRYKTEVDCLEGREADPNKSKGNCVHRYPGEDIKFTYYQAKAVYKFQSNYIGNSGLQSTLISFPTKENCEERLKVTSIFKINSPDDTKINRLINPFGSSHEDRFITGCQPKTEVVCKKDTSRPYILDFLD